MNLLLMGPTTMASMPFDTSLAFVDPMTVRMTAGGLGGVLLYIACDFVLRGTPNGVVYVELDDERARRTSAMLAELAGLGLTDIEEM